MQDDTKDMIGIMASAGGTVLAVTSVFYLSAGHISSSVEVGSVAVACLAPPILSEYFNRTAAVGGVLVGTLLGVSMVENLPQSPKISLEVQRLERKMEMGEYKDLLPPSVAAVKFYPSDFAKD